MADKSSGNIGFAKRLMGRLAAISSIPARG
jgi:hypothetical protein